MGGLLLPDSGCSLHSTLALDIGQSPAYVEQAPRCSFVLPAVTDRPSLYNSPSMGCAHQRDRKDPGFEACTNSVDFQFFLHKRTIHIGKNQHTELNSPHSAVGTA